MKLGAPADLIRFTIDEKSGDLDLKSVFAHGEEVFHA